MNISQERIDAWVQKQLADSPELTDEQIERLARVFARPVAKLLAETQRDAA